ncbi:MAG: hypothetical protein HYT69_02530 [Candidatus Zambryskibacteria bacterium]|nr:hypothetical protein [Candidatus Zambryskibacteria bacterium]
MTNINKHLEAGQAMIVATIFFLVISLALILGLTGPVLRQRAIASDLISSRQSYFLAEAGLEDVLYRLKTGQPVSSTEVLNIGGGIATTITTDTSDGKQIVATADINEAVRKVRTNITIGSGASFHFGVQAGAGGVIMENTSSILGNVYSNGRVIGSGPLNNIVRGSIVSAGANGLIEKLHATSSAYAHTIKESEIDGDAYYQTIFNTTVLGISYPGSPDQSVSVLPISDEQIEEWEQVALDGGTISSPCPYKITGTATIGPVKINCDLEITGNNYTVTLNGNVWVKGNIIIRNSPTIRAASAFGNKGVVAIADNPSNPITSGVILIENSAVFQGSGSPGSYVLMISGNRSAQQGWGSLAAMDVKNSVSGNLLVYAGHGEIRLHNSVNLKEVSAYRIRLKNTAQIVYDTGITNLLFDSGPSGGYEILNWREIE